MPTPVGDQALPPSSQPHQHRQVAESFGVDPRRYDRARPSYPPALVERILSTVPGPDVLDVGCGTGIEARQFRAAGATVLGVDPDERMAAYARSTGVDVEVATFEDWDPSGREFDAVVAGQSWHWVDPVVGAAKAARVLRPGGRLAVFAHVFAAPPAVSGAFAEAFARVAPDSPFAAAAASSAGRSALETYRAGFVTFADGMRRAGGFAEPEQWSFEWEQSYTRDQWLDHLPTTGALTRLPADALARVLDAVGTAVDGIGGGFTLPYTTLAATAVRRAG
ncbi:class I SAM-dependent methyltransferase [Pseudonocardia lacus]|jgi:SAM-dependent methyltransferase|uniref:class I SAM-dependent methyltransferase n=1 Tax=Pseudonocardia lacus TaxID=2835865 RepID=UPI001BDCD160|nr:class I SAM-dependent methyltransferase [Pseudonocardia lacus]